MSGAARKRLARIAAHPSFTAALVSAALTVLLYADTLALPLFSDDLVQIPWLESIAWGELWASPSPYGYYRPLWYSLWRVWGALAGGLHPAGLHALNVLAHLIASWLAGLLAATWSGSPNAQGREARILACVASALFAAFPFSRQAVAWPGAVYNPLVSAMAAGALLSHDRARRGHGLRWLALALLLAVLSAFTYEAGLLVAPLVILAEIVGTLRHRWERKRWWRWALPFAGSSILTVLVWRAMRGEGAIGFGLDPVDLRQNAGYLVQGLIYPIAPLAQRMAAQLGIDPEICLWSIALPILGLLAWDGLRRHSGAFLLGAGWFGLFALPPLVSMEAAWFALAPRFLYMTAGGVALIWAAFVSTWLARLRRPWHLPATGILLLALLTPAVLFVRDGVRLYRMAGEPIWEAAAAAEREHPLLLVNLPLRITPRDRVYPLGFEGVTPLPTRVTAGGLVYVHTGIPDAAEAVSFGAVAPEQPEGYTYELHGRPVGWEELTEEIGQAHTVYLARYEAKRIRLAKAGALIDSDDSEKEPLASFARDGESGKLHLLDATPVCSERQIQLTLLWQIETETTTDVTAFVHLVDSTGELVAQADGHPLLGMQPFWALETGTSIQDEREFDLVPSGEYTIRLGLWEPSAGERWPAEGTVSLQVTCTSR